MIIEFPSSATHNAIHSRNELGRMITSFFYYFADIPELVFMETRPRPNLSVETIYFTDCIASWDNVGVSERSDCLDTIQ